MTLHYVKRIKDIFAKQYWNKKGYMGQEGCLWYPLDSEFIVPPEVPNFMRTVFPPKWYSIGCMERIRTTHHNCLIKCKPENKPVLDLLTKEEVERYIDMLVDKFPSADRLFDIPEADRSKLIFHIHGDNAVENYVLMNVVRNIWANPIAVIVMNEFVKMYPKMDWIMILLHEAYTRPVLGYRHRQSTLVDFEHDSGQHNVDAGAGLYTRIQRAGGLQDKGKQGNCTQFGYYVKMQSIVSPAMDMNYYTFPTHGVIEPNYRLLHTVHNRLMHNGTCPKDMLLRTYSLAQSLPADQRPMLLCNMSDKDVIPDSQLVTMLASRISQLFDQNYVSYFFKHVTPRTVYDKVKTNLGIVPQERSNFRW